jgi:hypothetical protein
VCWSWYLILLTCKPGVRGTRSHTRGFAAASVSDEWGRLDDKLQPNKRSAGALQLTANVLFSCSCQLSTHLTRTA